MPKNWLGLVESLSVGGLYSSAGRSRVVFSISFKTKSKALSSPLLKITWNGT